MHNFTDPNENTIQALCTALCIEFGKNFTNAWQKFSTICEKFVNAPAVSMTRLYMIVVLISCNASYPAMNSRIFANILNGFLEKLQRQELAVVTKDMMSFLNFLVSFSYTHSIFDLRSKLFFLNSRSALENHQI